MKQTDTNSALYLRHISSFDDGCVYVKNFGCLGEIDERVVVCVLNNESTFVNFTENQLVQMLDLLQQNKK